MIFYLVVLISLVLSYLFNYEFDLISNPNIFKFLLVFLGIGVVIVFFLTLYMYIIALAFKNNYKSKFARKNLVMMSNVIMAFYGVHLSFEYKTKLPEKSNFAVISNHQSFIDVLVMFRLFKNYFISGIAKKEMEKVFFLKAWMDQTRFLGLDRKNNKKGILTIIQASKQISEGQPMIIFPEGTRTNLKGGEMLEFKPGALNMATKANADIYLVCIHNLHTRRTIILPKFIKVTLLEPLTYEEYKDLSTIEISEICRERINKCRKEGFRGKNTKSNRS